MLERVEAPVPGEVRSWLRRDFFPFHLKQYSKSRRKAPIYWPLATASGSYCLWVYFPQLTSQTLYTAVNDFLEPKLKQVGEETARLRNQGTARTRAEEKQFETLQTFELELIELRDTLEKALGGSGIALLSMTPAIARTAVQLPEHHRDSQDRLIIATALAHKATLISADEKFPLYSELAGALLQ